MNTTALTVSHLADAEVSLNPEAITLRDELVQKASLIKTVTDEASQALAVAAVRDLKAISKAVEANRTALKAPVLALGRQIDTLAKEFTAGIEAESRRIEQRVASYQAEQRRLQEEEERRRQQIARKAEEEQRRLAEERAAKEAAAAAALLAEQRAAEDALFAMLGDEPATTEHPPAASQPAGPTAAELQAEADALRKRESEAEAAKLQQMARTPARSLKVNGLAVQERWTFTVTSLPELYQHKPDLVKLEARTAEINAAIKAGLRTCPGLRIFEETKAVVR